jgi:hypothetical protein
MAEFLIKARGNQWMENLPLADWVSKGLTQERYNARDEKGDIIVVKPDGWGWGKCECLPGFVVIKIPQLDWEKAKFVIEKSLYETTTISGEERQVVRKKRIYRVPATLVDEAIANKGILTLTTKDAIGYIQKRSLNISKEIIESNITAQEFI